MSIQMKGTATCTQCKTAVEITIGIGTAHSWNGVIGPGSSGSQYHTVYPHLPDGWIDSEFSGHFCSEKCEDDYTEAKYGNRPNETRRKEEEARAAKEAELRAKMQAAISPEDRVKILTDLMRVTPPFDSKDRRRRRVR